MAERRIEEIAAWVRDNMVSDGGAHDWHHVHRVRVLSEAMAAAEGARTNLTLLCALLHDISDYKLNGGDRSRAAAMARARLGEDGFTADTIDSVAAFLTLSGYSQHKRQDRSGWPLEWKIVQDADYLDAIGAVGVARVFWFAGYRQEPIFGDSRLPPLDEWPEAMAADHSTLAHFEQKLLRLHGLMLTASGRRLAARRHQRMRDYLQQLIDEWNCADVGAP